MNAQIQYVASSAYKKLKSNRDEMLHALAELFHNVFRDLKVAIFDDMTIHVNSQPAVLEHDRSRDLPCLHIVVVGMRQNIVKSIACWDIGRSRTNCFEYKT